MSGFVEGLAGGRLRLLACRACGTRQTLDPAVCRACGSDALEWTDVSGAGRVHAVTEVHRAPTPAFKALVPYALVLVDLDGGGRLMGHAEPGLAIGAAVTATIFHHAGEPLVRFVRPEAAR